MAESVVGAFLQDVDKIRSFLGRDVPVRSEETEPIDPLRKRRLIDGNQLSEHRVTAEEAERKR